MKIEPQFDQAEPFDENGFARVDINPLSESLWVYINKNGEIIKPKAE